MANKQYMCDIMQRYKNKIVYDANTGEVKDDRKNTTVHVFPACQVVNNYFRCSLNPCSVISGDVSTFQGRVDS